MADLRSSGEFEDRIRNLLKDYGFEDVDGGTRFRLGGHQIDACGGYGRTLLVVECTTKRGRRVADLHKKILELRGKISQIERDARHRQVYRKYRKFRYLIATNVGILPKDMAFAKRAPEVHMWNSQSIEYYEELGNLLRDTAIFNMLGELDFVPLSRERVQVPALRIVTRSTVLYSFYVNPHELMKAAYVARREEGKELYYQRMVKLARLKRIEKYIGEGSSIFPNNIILAFISHPIFVRTRHAIPRRWTGLQFGILKFPRSYRSAWIIDGQHRLFGMIRSRKIMEASATAFESLQMDEQARYFLDINSEQKPVPPDLLWDLQGHLRPEQLEGIISEIVRRLDDEGPLAGKIYIPLKGSSTNKPVKFSGLCIALKRCKLIESPSAHMQGRIKNPLRSHSPSATVNNTAKVLLNYLGFMDDIFSKKMKEDFFFQNSGLSVMFYFYERMLAAAEGVPSDLEVRSILKLLRDYMKSSYSTTDDLATLRGATTSESGRSAVCDEFAAAVNVKLKPETRLPISKRAQAEQESYKEIERKTRESLDVVLRKVSKNWIKERTSLGIYTRVLELHKANKHSKERDLLTLGQCKEIIDRTDNWQVMEPLLAEGRAGFGKKESFIDALHNIIKNRNPEVHGRDAIVRYGDVDLLRAQIKKMRACIDDAWSKAKNYVIPKNLLSIQRIKS